MLATHPSFAPELEQSDTKLRSFVEETLRLYGQLEFRPRRAKHDLVLAGTEIKKGELVLVLTAAANRDPAHYGCPSSLNLERPSPRDHFAFFMGPRTCPGQSLARFQTQRTLKVVVDRLRDLRLDAGADAPEWRGAVVRRWEPLHCLFTA
jgi:cytochrome P450